MASETDLTPVAGIVDFACRRRGRDTRAAYVVEFAAQTPIPVAMDNSSGEDNVPIHARLAAEVLGKLEESLRRTRTAGTAAAELPDAVATNANGEAALKYAASQQTQAPRVDTARTILR